MRLKSQALCWLFLGAFGAAAAIIALDYKVGTLNDVGSAIAPLFFAGVIIAISLFKLILGDDEPPLRPDLQPLAAVTVAIVAFALLVDWLGLGPSVIASVVIAYLGQSERGYGFVLFYAASLSAGIWLVFSLALGLPLPFIQGL